MAVPERGLSSGIMLRIVSVWLKAWPIARLLRAQASASPVEDRIKPVLDPAQSLVLVAPGKGGQRIVALNRAACAGGLSLGELLSNARSKVLNLQICDADPAADRDALRKLALWAMRYCPVVAIGHEASGADGLFLDITGAAQLFGGEERLLADLQRRLGSFGLYPRLAVAGTAGAAWALARYGKRNRIILSPGEERKGIEDLPLAALRLPEEVLTVLRRLGFRRCGELIDQPRAPFGARFDAPLLSRLDQALGRASEPLIPVVPPPIYRVQVQFLEPILQQEHVLEAARCLLERLMQDLARDAVGVRLLRLLLFKLDGAAVSLDLGLAAPSRDAQHLAQLIGLRLYRLHSEFETDFGFEAAALHVLSAEDMPEQQNQLAIAAHTPAPEALARLIDRLQQRLGVGAVGQLIAQQSHIPERAVRHVKGFALPKASRNSPARPRHDTVRSPEQPLPWAPDMPAGERPFLLLPRPEAADVVALVPEGPPRQFRWRGVRHQVAYSGGPERIAAEWWRRTGEASRDYYVVEDTTGRRFWLFRAGLYDRETDPPQWFVHGVFG
jgi:protein ImuB